MSTIDGKHWYRFNFLKSEAWETIRLEVLVEFDAVCQICLIRDLQNDVHHIWYDDPKVREPNQMTVLCRSCHDKIHRALEPCSAKTEADKIAALDRFNAEKKRISYEYKIGDKILCSGCLSHGAFPFDPVTRDMVDIGKGIKLCRQCRDDVLKLLPPRGDNSRVNDIWDIVRKRVSEIRASKTEELKRFNELTTLRWIPQLFAANIRPLTFHLNPIRVGPVFETMRHRRCLGATWTAVA